MKELCCALSGHREIPQNFDKNSLYDALEELIKEGYTYFCCGMLECLVELKQRYHVRIEACIPYAGQAAGFSAAEKRNYRNLLAWCDEKTVLFEEYTRGCLLARNRYMVDKADLVFSYCVREKGGTAYTVRYANEHGVPVKRF